MQVTVLSKVVEVASLDVVRLVASARGIEDVDVEAFPEKTTISFNGGSVAGKNLDEACEKFFRRFLT